MDTWTKGKSYLSKLGGHSWMHAIAMGGIRKGPICAKRYTFMLTNPAYEVSLVSPIYMDWHCPHEYL